MKLVCLSTNKKSGYLVIAQQNRFAMNTALATAQNRQWLAIACRVHSGEMYNAHLAPGSFIGEQITTEYPKREFFRRSAPN